MKRIICLASLLMIISAGLKAGSIEYDKKEKAVIVTGFEEARPANMARYLPPTAKINGISQSMMRGVIPTA